MHLPVLEILLWFENLFKNIELLFASQIMFDELF